MSTWKDIKNKHFLVDGDVLVHRICWAAHPKPKDGESQIDYGWEHVLQFAIESCNSPRGPCSSPSREIFLSGDKNFRYTISKTKPYKSSRQNRVKPPYFQRLREYFKEVWGARETDGIEADDALGIALTRDPKGSCILSIDSDLLQISGWNYDWTKNIVQWISRKAGDFNLYTKILSGDSGDSIPGIPGIGKIKAAKILKGSQSSRELCQRTWDAYRNYSSAGIEWAREYFLEQANLVYVLRRREDHFQVPIELN